MFAKLAVIFQLLISRSLSVNDFDSVSCVILGLYLEEAAGDGLCEIDGQSGFRRRSN